MNTTQILKELRFKTSLSGGKGGQHVNKVSSKVILYFNIEDSEGLEEEEKERLKRKLSNQINKEGELVLHCEESRSQFRNKKLIQQKLIEKLSEALKKQNKRLKLKPSRAMVKKRLNEKKKHQEKKSRRRGDKNPDL